jgi:hypothetical protein
LLAILVLLNKCKAQSKYITLGWSVEMLRRESMRECNSTGLITLILIVDFNNLNNTSVASET